MRFGSIQIGFNSVDGIPFRKASLLLGNDAKIVFGGSARIGAGTSIRVDSGILEIGEKFTCNNDCFISCSKDVRIGKNCLFGWNVNLRDADGHTVYYDGKAAENEKAVQIGDHVWIAAYVDILKGTSIADDCIVGYKSLVAGKYQQRNTLIVGHPARVVKENIEWEK